jgi:glycine cleavage system H protein
MSKILADRMYSKDHEWVKMEDGFAVVGITDHAQDALGEIVYVELPELGDKFEAGEEVSNIESVKAASPILSPASGEICEVNEELDGSPELVNEDPYSAYIYKMKDAVLSDDLLDAEAYEKFLEEEN